MADWHPIPGWFCCWFRKRSFPGHHKHILPSLVLHYLLATIWSFTKIVQARWSQEFPCKTSEEWAITHRRKCGRHYWITVSVPKTALKRRFLNSSHLGQKSWWEKSCWNLPKQHWLLLSAVTEACGHAQNLSGWSRSLWNSCRKVRTGQVIWNSQGVLSTVWSVAPCYGQATNVIELSKITA